MICLLCRNRVGDYARWMAVFASHEHAHQEAGLQLIKIWRSTDEPNNIFFLFDVASEELARRFIEHPEAAGAAEASGVIDGEYYFIEDAGRY